MKDLDLALSILCRVVLAFMGVIFLFGQMFFATFEWHSTAMAVGAFLLAGLTGLPVGAGPKLTQIGLAGGAAALVATGVDIHAYYAAERSPGNYYAWFLILPFVGAAIFVMVTGARGQTLR